MAKPTANASRLQKPEEDSAKSWVRPHAAQKARAKKKKFYHVDVCLAASAAAAAAKPSEAPIHVPTLESLAKEPTPNAAPAAASSGAGAWTWTPGKSVDSQDEATHEEDALRRESLAETPEKRAAPAPGVKCAAEAKEQEEVKSFAETPRKCGEGAGGGPEKRTPDAWGKLEARVQPEGEPCGGGEIALGRDPVGWKIRKKFKGWGWLCGTVVGYNSMLERYRVIYYKGHSEDLVLTDLVKVKRTPDA